MFKKFQTFIKDYSKEIVLTVAVILISLFSFAVGYITAKMESKKPLKIEKLEERKIAIEIQNKV